MNAKDVAVTRVCGTCSFDQVNRNSGPQRMVADCESTRDEEGESYRGGRPIRRYSSFEKMKVLRKTCAAPEPHKLIKHIQL